MITLEEIQAKQNELAAMIEQFEAAQSKERQIELPGGVLTLQEGERYAGIVLDEAGNFRHHLILLPGVIKDVNWETAVKWANKRGGELPTRQEWALMFANCKTHVQPRWYWTGETHEDDASLAWDCFFDTGHQSNVRKDCEGGTAVAVRRVWT